MTWRKNNIEIRPDASHVVKAEGEKHSLAIKETRQSDAGSYCVTAVNPAGRASCSAVLRVQSGETGPEMDAAPAHEAFRFRLVYELKSGAAFKTQPTR